MIDEEVKGREPISAQDARLKQLAAANQRYPRWKAPANALDKHRKLVARAIVERSIQQCHGIGCNTLKSVSNQTDKAIQAGELLERDLPDVATLVAQDLKGRMFDAKQQINVKRTSK
jgi:hypothetical protein